jgi:hypothetical protein
MFNLDKTVLVIAGIILGSVHTASAWKPASTVDTDILAAAGLVKLGVWEALHGVGNCSLANAAIRQEWYSTSQSMRSSIANQEIGHNFSHLREKLIRMLCFA